MSDSIIIKVPTISDFAEVDVIEVLISPGDTVAIESPLITLESDKASMDVPSPVSGQIADVRVEILNPTAQTNESHGTSPPIDPVPESEMSPGGTESRPDSTAFPEAADFEVDLVVIGSGPGGYTAAFRAADLGLDTVLVEKDPTLGGVCLNVGCIPSKTLLHTARVIEETKELQAAGLDFGPPVINLERLRGWKEKVVGQLTEGLTALAKQRKVAIIQGEGRFASDHRIIVRSEDEDAVIDFRHAIIAAGSEPVLISDLPDDGRIMNSTQALDLVDIPERLLVIGGGIIGLEIATVYQALGSRITIVEMLDQLMPGTDKDLLRPLQKRLQNQCDDIFLGTRVIGIETHPDHLMVSFEGPKAPAADRFDRVLVAVGRSPHAEPLQVEAAGVAIDPSGFILVNAEQRTNVPHIFAIVDIVGQIGCSDRTRLPGWAGQPNLCRTGFSPQIRNSHAIRRPSRRACPRPTGQYRGEVAKPEIVANEFPAARHLDWRTFAVQRRDQQSLAIAIRLGNCATDGEGNLAVVRRDAKYTSIGSSDRCANIRNPDLSVHCPLT